MCTGIIHFQFNSKWSPNIWCIAQFFQLPRQMSCSWVPEQNKLWLSALRENFLALYPLMTVRTSGGVPHINLKRKNQTFFFLPRRTFYPLERAWRKVKCEEESNFLSRFFVLSSSHFTFLHYFHFFPCIFGGVKNSQNGTIFAQICVLFDF